MTIWGKVWQLSLVVLWDIPSTCRWCQPWCCEGRRRAHCPQSVQAHFQTDTDAAGQGCLCKEQVWKCELDKLSPAEQITFGKEGCGWCDLEVFCSQRLRHFLVWETACTQNCSAETPILWNSLCDAPVSKVEVIYLTIVSGNRDWNGNEFGWYSRLCWLHYCWKNILNYPLKTIFHNDRQDFWPEVCCCILSYQCPRLPRCIWNKTKCDQNYI